MSSTSEELASQAEELQASIAFFRVDNRSMRMAAAPQGRMMPAGHAAAHTSAQVPRAAARPSQTRSGERSVAGQQARAKGFALDMSMGGPDGEDHDFRETA